MRLAPDSTAQLVIYAQLGVGLAGFAGVIGAFSRFRIHIEATPSGSAPWSPWP